ncbi:hypothetical protein PRIPAC_95912 [Pristionchus pacificus]|uniref:Uncharacterized protein n=1 Tax=Pristionchus pacificus TaxID=54126 RepID=A0A2A6BDA0_PRIPA|nr:hypothetical protein PRIPAC_95912 [Pristionchus pacificus]|eukprot:PDM63857.1 hypothetical protein PRIPAC_49830 [Pristionchus pacificus]
MYCMSFAPHFRMGTYTSQSSNLAKEEENKREQTRRRTRRKRLPRFWPNLIQETEPKRLGEMDGDAE